MGRTTSISEGLEMTSVLLDSYDSLFTDQAFRNTMTI